MTIEQYEMEIIWIKVSTSARGDIEEEEKQEEMKGARH